MNHRRLAALLAASATALLSMPTPADAAVTIPPSTRPCPSSNKVASLVFHVDPRDHVTSFTLDNPCRDWVMTIFLGAPADAVFRLYAAPGTHLAWNAAQARQHHIKDGGNGNPLMIKAPRCSKQGRREIIVEAGGRVHANPVCKK